MGLQGFEGCDIPCEPGWQLQATDADCAEEDGGPTIKELIALFRITLASAARFR